jgi:hypothetical protein
LYQHRKDEFRKPEARLNCIGDKISKRPALSIPSDHGSLPPVFSIILISSHLILFHPLFSSLFSPSLILLTLSYHPYSPRHSSLFSLYSHPYSPHFLIIHPAVSSHPDSPHHPSLFTLSSHPYSPHLSSFYPYLSVLLIICPIFSSLFVRSSHPNLSVLLIIMCSIFSSYFVSSSHPYLYVFLILIRLIFSSLFFSSSHPD